MGHICPCLCVQIVSLCMHTLAYVYSSSIRPSIPLRVRSIRVRVHVRVRACAFMHACIRAHMTFQCVHLHVFMRMCVCAHSCAPTCLRMQTHTHLHTCQFIRKTEHGATSPRTGRACLLAGNALCAHVYARTRPHTPTHATRNCQHQRQHTLGTRHTKHTPRNSGKNRGHPP